MEAFESAKVTSHQPSQACVPDDPARNSFCLTAGMELKQTQHSLTLVRLLRAAGCKSACRKSCPGRSASPPPGIDLQPRTNRQSRFQHNSIEQIALEAEVRRGRAVIERAPQRRYEIDVAGRAALAKAAPRNLYHNFDFTGL